MVSTSFRRWKEVWVREASTECVAVRVVTLAEADIADKVVTIEIESLGCREAFNSRSIGRT